MQEIVSYKSNTVKLDIYVLYDYGGSSWL